MEDVKILISAEPIGTVEITWPVQEMEADTGSVLTPVTGRGVAQTPSAWW